MTPTDAGSGATVRLTTAEALVRWRHPQLGELLPATTKR